MVQGNTTWSVDRELCSDLRIASGTLVLEASLTMPYDAIVTIKSGAVLEIRGGNILNADIHVKPGGKLILSAEGKLELFAPDELNIGQG